MSVLMLKTKWVSEMFDSLPLTAWKCISNKEQLLTFLNPNLLGEHVVGQHCFLSLWIFFFLEWDQGFWLCGTKYGVECAMCNQQFMGHEKRKYGREHLTAGENNTSQDGAMINSTRLPRILHSYFTPTFFTSNVPWHYFNTSGCLFLSSIRWWGCSKLALGPRLHCCTCPTASMCLSVDVAVADCLSSQCPC